MLDEMGSVRTMRQPHKLNGTSQVAKSGTVGRIAPAVGVLFARNPGPIKGVSQIIRIVVRVVNANPVALSRITALVVHNHGCIIHIKT